MRKIKAFTLVELLVVILIIAVLSGLVIFSLSGTIKKAKDARAIDSIRKVQTAISQMQSESGGAGLTSIEALNRYQVQRGAEIDEKSFKSSSGDVFFQTAPKDAGNNKIWIHIISADAYYIYGKSSSPSKCWYVSESINNLSDPKPEMGCNL